MGSAQTPDNVSSHFRLRQQVKGARIEPLQAAGQKGLCMLQEFRALASLRNAGAVSSAA
jgi:hypothetical protein